MRLGDGMHDRKAQAGAWGIVFNLQERLEQAMFDRPGAGLSRSPNSPGAFMLGASLDRVACSRIPRRRALSSVVTIAWETSH